MKVNKLLLLVAIPAAIQLLFSCTCCDCEDDPVEPLVNESCMFENVEIDFLENSGASPVVTTADSISRSVFGMQLRVDYAQSFCSNNTFDLWFLPSANAFSCDCDDVAPILYPVQKFEIISVNPLDSLSQDSIVTNRFRYLSFDNYYPVDPTIFNHQKSVDLILTDFPNKGGEHQFIINFSLSDSTSFSDTTKSVYLF